MAPAPTVAYCSEATALVEWEDARRMQEMRQASELRQLQKRHEKQLAKLSERHATHASNEECADNQDEWVLDDELSADIIGFAEDSRFSRLIRVQRELGRRKRLAELRRRTGLDGELGRVHGQVGSSSEVYAQKGQVGSLLAINALELGLIVSLSSHALWRSAPIAAYLKGNPDRLRQVRTISVHATTRYASFAGEDFSKPPSKKQVAYASGLAMEVRPPRVHPPTV